MVYAEIQDVFFTSKISPSSKLSDLNSSLYRAFKFPSYLYVRYHFWVGAKVTVLIRCTVWCDRLVPCKQKKTDSWPDGRRSVRFG